MKFSVFSVSLCGLILLALFISGSLFFGLSPEALLDHTSMERMLLVELRLPRVLAALMVGASLALAGHMMQILLENPLAEPGIVGLSSGAALAAVVSIVIVPGSLIADYLHMVLPVAGFFGALVAISFIFLFTRLMGQFSTSAIILGGICLTTIFSAITSWLIYFSDNTQLRQLSLWFMGSFSQVTWSVIVPVIVVLSLVLFWVPGKLKALDLLYLGEENARLYGVDTHRLRVQILLVVALITGLSVATAGVIAFVGLIIPHMVRMTIGYQQRIVLPAILLAGGSFMVLVEGLSRHLSVLEFPPGLVTASLGGPLLLFILIRQTRLMISQS